RRLALLRRLGLALRLLGVGLRLGRLGGARLHLVALVGRAGVRLQRQGAVVKRHRLLRVARLGRGAGLGQQVVEGALLLRVGGALRRLVGRLRLLLGAEARRLGLLRQLLLLFARRLGQGRLAGLLLLPRRVQPRLLGLLVGLGLERLQRRVVGVLR